MWWLGYGLKDEEAMARFLTGPELFTLENLLDRLYDPAIYNGHPPGLHADSWPALYTVMTADGTMKRLANIDYIRHAHGYLVWANIKWLCSDGHWVIPDASLVHADKDE